MIKQEIRATLRKEGISNLSDVVFAHLEADGEISVRKSKAETNMVASCRL